MLKYTVNRKKNLLLVIFCSFLVVFIVAIGFRFFYKKRKPQLMIKENQGVYWIGEVRLDTENKQIEFNGKVVKNKNWVQHLIYLEGYKWLKEESAIISLAKLSDLQKAIALIDWKLWDELFYGDSQKIETKEQRLHTIISWNDKEINANELVKAEDKLRVQDLVFLGSPYFDYIALESPGGINCRVCPFFPLEEKALREMFVRPSGKSGYELNSEKMPPPQTSVKIIIKFLYERSS